MLGQLKATVRRNAPSLKWRMVRQVLNRCSSETTDGREMTERAHPDLPEWCSKLVAGRLPQQVDYASTRGMFRPNLARRRWYVLTRVWRLIASARMCIIGSYVMLSSESCLGLMYTPPGLLVRQRERGPLGCIISFL